MKHKYEGLLIDSEQPDSMSCDFFQRMAIGDRFRFIFIIKFDCGNFSDSLVDEDNPLSAKILSITSAPDGFIMEIDTSGEVAPPGIKHGRYTLKFTNDSLVCEDLPDEIFKN